MVGVDALARTQRSVHTPALLIRASSLVAVKSWVPALRSSVRTLHRVRDANAPYALAMSGKTASILVFSVAALNGLTM